VSATVDERLTALAAHLEFSMAHRLLELLDASSGVSELVELRGRLRQSDDLVAELRRHLAIRERQLREARQRNLPGEVL